MLKYLKNFYPATFNNYYEPFVGGGAVFFNLQPTTHAYLSDLNVNLINLYKTVKNDLDEFLNRLSVHFANHTDDYYRNLERYDMRTIKSDYIQQAADYYYIVRFQMMNSAILSAKGKLSKTPKMNQRPIFEKTAERFKMISNILNTANASINLMDWKEAIKDAQSGDFIYLDPPYDAVDNSYNNRFTQYTTVEMFELLQELDKKGVKWILSNTNSPLVKLLYKDYNFYTFEVQNTLSTFSLHASADKNKKSKTRLEHIITNFNDFLNPEYVASLDKDKPTTHIKK